MKRELRRLLSLVPTPFWTRRYPHLNRLEHCKKSVLCEKLMRESGNMVFAGPFSTMKLAGHLELAGDPRYIVGSYEQEIHGVINEMIASAPATVIDIGSAHGYYGVGFALKVPGAKVITFEAEEVPYWRQQYELACLNGVADHILQLGLCTAKALAAVCAPGSFILCDCEGGEEDVLDLEVVPSLSSCRLLVEIHEFFRPKLVGRLAERFSATHDIRFIEEATRNPAQFRILKKLPARWRAVAIEEAKWFDDLPTPRMTWLRFMQLTPK